MQIENETIHRFIDGDVAAFRAVFRALVRDVFALAYRRLGRKELAEDIVQETFMKIYQMRDRVDPRRSLRALILRIATNRTLDVIRRSQRECISSSPDETIPIGDGQTTSAEFEEQQTEQMTIDQALDKLPEIYRSVLLLKYAHDLSYQEISQALNISVPAVALRLKRGKEILRRKLRCRFL